nr:uncharacterized protein CTRU02_13605 [Colletotrichum truncatum]KAF6783137.1 hypothetical protein CTRU02_13605 [Colletotrichum truncatum]
MKFISFLGAFVPLAILVIADPPACLLAALGQQGIPSGIEQLCTEKQTAMLSNLTSLCENNALRPAYDSYASTCSEIGVKVDSLPASSSVPAATVDGMPGSSTPHVTSPPSSTNIPLVSISAPRETKPASTAGAIAPHALLFTLFGLSTTGLFSIVFL